jgi:hypothetical protein
VPHFFIMKAELFSDPADYLAWSTAGAIVTALVLQRQSGGVVQLSSDLLCWSLVLVWFEVLPLLRRSGSSPEKAQTRAVGYFPWIAAGAIALSSLASSYTNVRWLLVSFLQWHLTQCRYMP